MRSKPRRAQMQTAKVRSPYLQSRNVVTKESKGTNLFWFGALLATFVTGIYFGQRNKTDLESAQADLSGIVDADQVSDQYDEIKKSIKLTFHKELTESKKASAVSLSMQQPLKVELTEKIPAKAEVNNEKNISLKKTVQIKKTEKKIVKKVTPKSAARKADSVKKSNKKDVVNNEMQALRKSLLKNAKQSSVESFFVQIASLPNRSAGEKMLLSLKSKGLDGQLVSAVLSDGRTVFRLQSKTILGQENARKFVLKVNNALKVQALLRKKK